MKETKWRNRARRKDKLVWQHLDMAHLKSHGNGLNSLPYLLWHIKHLF